MHTSSAFFRGLGWHTYLHIEFFLAAGKSVSFWRPVDKSNALTEHLADLDAIHFYSAVNFGESTLILAYIFLFKIYVYII